MSSNIYNKVIFGKYKLSKLLGKGSFGLVYKGKNIINGENVAIKMEEWKKKGNILEGEAYFLYYLRSIGIPEVKSFGVYNKYKILVQTLLGDSLEALFIKMKYKFTIKDICMIAIQLLDRLEFIHSKFIIHRDLKPENIMVDLETKSIIYLIDFGLAKKYRSGRSGKHIKFTIPRRLTGTARYASANALRGTEQSRRDDLEAAAYVLIYLAKKGDLPWTGLNISNKIERYKKIYYIKKNIKPENLCKGLPQEIADFLKYIKGLQFEEDPNYVYLRGLFIQILNKKELSNDLNFSWLKNNEIKNVLQIKNYENKHGRMSSLTKKKSCPQARLLKNIQTSKEREKNIKKISENKLLNEIEEKQEQREKEFILKKKIKKEKKNELRINEDEKNISKITDFKNDLEIPSWDQFGTQIALYNQSINIEDIDFESKIDEKPKTSIKIPKEKIIYEKIANNNNKLENNKNIYKNNAHKNIPILFNLKNGSFNNAPLGKSLSHCNIKYNFFENDKIFNYRNNRTSIQSPKLTEDFIKNKLISKLKDNKNNISTEKINQKKNYNLQGKIIVNKNDKQTTINHLNYKNILNKVKDNKNKEFKNNYLNYKSPIKDLLEKTDKQKLFKLNDNNIFNNKTNNTNLYQNIDNFHNIKKINIYKINSPVKNNINKYNNNNINIISKNNSFNNNKGIKNDEIKKIQNNLKKNKSPKLFINNSSKDNLVKRKMNIKDKICINEFIHNSQKNLFKNRNTPFNQINKKEFVIKSLENDHHIKRKIYQALFLNKLNSSRDKNNTNKNINNYISNSPVNNIYNNKIKQFLHQNKKINLYKKGDNKTKLGIKTLQFNKNEKSYLNNINHINTDSNINIIKKFKIPKNLLFNNSIKQKNLKNNYNNCNLYNNLYNNNYNNICNNSYINTTKNHFNFNIINDNNNHINPRRMNNN